VESDGQVLVLHDMIGLFDRLVPKFVKKYANVSEDVLTALNAYAKEVAVGQFPGPERSFTMKEDVLKRLY
jgi:3-methyl-2-oxobutanoate hydroxymethyltransferase